LAESFDCVIVGGGAVGTSCASHLLRNGFKGSLLLLEREEALGMGTTGRSVGGVRHQFPEEWNIRLSLMSVHELKAFRDELGRDPGFKQRGYLFMASRRETLSRLRRNIELQRKLASIVPPVGASSRNPVDVGGPGPPAAMLRAVMETVLTDADVDAIIVDEIDMTMFGRERSGRDRGELTKVPVEIKIPVYSSFI